MDLSPNDIRNYEFPTQLRGYEKDEVDKFKDQVAEALEQLKQENLKSSMEIESIKGQLAGLRQFEDAIKSAAIDARRNADLTIANAKKEAELLLNNARGEADRIVAVHSKKIADYEAQLTDLKLSRNSYVAKFRQLLNNHLEMVSEISTEAVVEDQVQDQGGDQIDVTDSSEVKTKTRETMATEPSKDTAIVTEEAQPSEEIAQAEPEHDFAAETPEEAVAPVAAEPEKDEDSIDPELAAALNNYQAGVSENQAQQEAPAPTPPAPAQDEIVETESRAEDIPQGFFAQETTVDASPSEQVITDKVSLPAADTQNEATEHASLSIDEDTVGTPKAPSLDPDNLAKELDSVVAKFEEEMEKADKT